MGKKDDIFKDPKVNKISLGIFLILIFILKILIRTFCGTIMKILSPAVIFIN